MVLSISAEKGTKVKGTVELTNSIDSSLSLFLFNAVMRLPMRKVLFNEN